MSRLDRHVALVQNKLTLARFFDALAWIALGYAVLVWAAVIIDRLFHLRLPRQGIWFLAGLGVVVISAAIWAFARRPTKEQAAVAIDERLALKEKFSTALYARPSRDPFAQAAVRDAERTADNVSLHKRFPLAFPRAGYMTIAAAVVVLLTAQFLPAMDLFGRQKKEESKAIQLQEQARVREAVQKALVTVQAMPKTAETEEAIKQAQKELKDLLAQPMHDTGQAQRNALKALQDVQEALRQQVKDSAKFATAQNDQKLMRSLMPPADDKGPVSDARRAIAQGKFDEAVEDLKKLSENFDKLDEEKKQDAAKQMQQMAQQLANMANNPAAQQQMQQQLQQLGANQQQAQQMQQLMQQAAQGNQQAAQQLQQMAQQMQQQMNNGQGPNPQQQQQVQQMMQQMQAQANAQQQAQQMQQAAQQMAQAMQQMQQAGKQQQQQGGAQNQGQQGQQAQQAMQQMAAAQQQMQQQMQAMQAAAADAQAVQAAQAQAQQAAQMAANGANGGQPGQPGGQGQGNANGQGQFLKGNDARMGQQGPGGLGRGAGARETGGPVPFGVKQEVSPSQDIDGGKILASFFVKAESLKGESKAQLQQVVKSKEQDVTDEVDQDRISGPSKKVVREYFETIAKDAK